MNILIVADTLPTPDRSSADFRFSQLVAAIAENHRVFFLVLDQKRQVDALGSDAAMRYRSALEHAGVAIVDGGMSRALRSQQYEAVVFEWYFAASRLIDQVRVWQPETRVIVDSVDVVFNRLEAKARITQSNDDLAKARAAKAAELAVYARSDVVITVTDADAAILHREDPGLATFTIPNIHPLHDPVAIGGAQQKVLVFVGSFARPGGETNVDAMLYFCADILPLIVLAEPEVKLRIIGGGCPPEISALRSAQVEVLGFVPDTKPFLETSAVSIAPLRFGGGMKGKIGEAMSFALPVVTTSIGIEGFGLEPGKDVLIGDDPKAFADAVIELLRSPQRREHVRTAGYQFIRDHYSDLAARRRVHALFGQLQDYPIKQISKLRSWRHRIEDKWERHIGWRLKY